ncbi:MAG: hypothetical protein AB7H97_10455, partial [Pseudobdellovibrionaceae bacterium]
FCLQNHEQYQQFRSNFWIRSLIGVGEAKIDPNKKSVTVEARTNKATATYVNDRLGCRVTNLRSKVRFKTLIDSQ